MNLDRYAKAVVAAIVAALGTLQVASLDGHITSTEVISSLVVLVAGLGLTYAVPNTLSDADIAQALAARQTNLK